MRSDQDEQQKTWMAAARDQELRLILAEERAERRVARAGSRLERARRRLERAERRVDRRVLLVKEAESELLACQERRATGPSPTMNAGELAAPCERAADGSGSEQPAPEKA
ncbi:hypothetical protein BH23CHL4_BH23CHL4_02590 [soil metagenome]